jgi:hypothetical protein
LRLGWEVKTRLILYKKDSFVQKDQIYETYLIVSGKHSTAITQRVTREKNEN